MTVTYILWVVLECIIFSVMVASICESSGGARHETMKIDAQGFHKHVVSRAIILFTQNPHYLY